MRTKFILSLTFLLAVTFLFAQEYPLVLNKQGSFTMTDWGAYTHYDCGYTKTETAANYQKLLAVINAIKKQTLF